MTPAAAIALLERQLTAHGEDIIVRRYTASTGSPRPKTDITVRASVRAVKAEELIGPIDMTGCKVVVSPTGLDALLPLKKGDKVVMQGRPERNIELPKPIYVDGTIVRIDLMVTG